MNRPCLFVAVLLGFCDLDLNPRSTCGSLDGSLFHEPAGVMGMPRMQEALKGIEYGAALTQISKPSMRCGTTMQIDLP